MKRAHAFVMLDMTFALKETFLAIATVGMARLVRAYLATVAKYQLVSRHNLLLTTLLLTRHAPIYKPGKIWLSSVSMFAVHAIFITANAFAIIALEYAMLGTTLEC